jgi:hypothetical protein
MTGMKGGSARYFPITVSLDRGSRMAFRSWYWISMVVLIGLAGCAAPEGDLKRAIAQPILHPDEQLRLPEAGQHEMFERYFQLERTIRLSGDVIVGGVDGLEVDNRGRFLLTDASSRQVFLFDDSGAYVTTLSATECDPGFEMMAMRGYFRRDGGIFLVNARAHPGFLFNDDGTCLGRPHETFWQQIFLTHDDAHMWGVTRQNGLRLRKMDLTGRRIQDFEIPNPNREFNSRFRGGGVVTDDAGYVYVSVSSSPFVMKYDPDGNYLGEIGWMPRSYRRADVDLPSIEGNVAALADEMSRARQRSSITWSFFRLGEDRLILQATHHYPSTDTLGSQLVLVMDNDGNPVFPVEFRWHGVFAAAGNNRAYRIMLRGEDEQGGPIINPLIHVYRLRD